MSCEKRVTAFKVKDTVNIQNVSECLDSFIRCDFGTTEHFVAKFSVVMQHHEPVSESSSIFKVKVTARAHVTKTMTVSAISSEVLIFLPPNLV